MRTIARQVAQAMGEQGRAARDIIKAGQATRTLAEQVRKATAEQAAGAGQMTQALAAMRKGADEHRPGRRRTGQGGRRGRRRRWTA